MIVQSFGALESMTGPPPIFYPGSSGGSINLYGEVQSYALLYARQPNVRTCVDFIARNIAQLGIQAFRRVSDTDRIRLTDHDVIRWLDHPNPSTVPYRLIESLVCDLGVYFNAYLLKIRTVADDGRPVIGMVRLPPQEVQVVGQLLPTGYIWTRNGIRREFALTEIMHFGGYNPLDERVGLSPLETLRRILAEEAAAGAHREAYWTNAARIDGVIERPATAKTWSIDQKKEWRKQWQERYSGGAGVGQVAVLEDGMTFKPTAWSSKDSEYLLARKLTREECAAQYHIPLPLVGILDHATFSNITEQHKNLYQDTLGPWLEMLQQEFMASLLPESDDPDGVYLEFNIGAKLAGSFEEQASSLLMLTGRPIMTGNEGRAKLNLPAMTDDPSADQLAAQQGGPSASAPRPQVGDPVARAAGLTQVLRSTWARQATRLAAYPVAQRANQFGRGRYAVELMTDLVPVLGTGAQEYAVKVTADTYALLVAGEDAFPTDREIPDLWT